MIRTRACQAAIAGLWLVAGLSVPELAGAETLRCQFKVSEGDAKLVPMDVSITTSPNSGQIVVQDSLNLAIGAGQVVGEEDGARKTSRRFVWKVENLPLAWLTKTQKVGVARRLLMSMIVNRDTQSARVTSVLPVISASSAQSALNVGRGRCKVSQ